MVESVLKALRVFDKRTLATAKAWLEMKQLKKCMFSLQDPVFSQPKHVATNLAAQFMKRWDIVLIDLHYASVLLNPFLMNIMGIQNNSNARYALNRIV
jgi:hypothetical protein